MQMGLHYWNNARPERFTLALTALGIRYWLVRIPTFNWVRPTYRGTFSLTQRTLCVALRNFEDAVENHETPQP